MELKEQIEQAKSSYTASELYEDIFKQIALYYEHDIFPVQSTKYSKLSLKQLLQLIESTDISQLSIEERLHYAQEISTRASTKISNHTNTVVFSPRDKEALMCAYIHFNIIEVNELNEYFLFNILHETYHQYQYQNFCNFLHHKSCDTDSALAVLQDLTCATYLNDKTQDVLYNFDFIEVEANLFACNFVLDCIEKGFFKDNENMLRLTNLYAGGHLKSVLKYGFKPVMKLYRSNVNLLACLKEKKYVPCMKSFYNLTKNEYNHVENYGKKLENKVHELCDRIILLARLNDYVNIN